MPFTPAQQQAISAPNPHLLVSAAAGSGKTAVLVERIFFLLRQEGYQMDRMLVVTFTHAAASEMRERLEGRLLEAAKESRAMRRQAELVETAQISTLHALCQRLVREFFEAVDIDPQALLCDERQRQTLLSQALGEALAQAYQQAAQGDEDARALTLKFTQTEIEGMLLALYAFLLAQPHPFQWLAQQAAHTYTQADLEGSPMAQALLQDSAILLEGAAALQQEAAALAHSPFCRDGYATLVQEDGALIAALREAAQEGLPALMTATAAAAFGRMPSYRLKDAEEIQVRDQLKPLRERYKAMVDSVQGLLPKDSVQSIQDLESMQPALRGLAHTVQAMHQLFQEMKREQALLDFSDLEHMTLHILAQPSLQAKIAARYDAIFVDEYQDISGIQEAILTALQREEAPLTAQAGDAPPASGGGVAARQAPSPSSPDTAGNIPPTAEAGTALQSTGGLPPVASTRQKPLRCFYVGDVKQSIYRFRQADPTLFMQKQRDFAPGPEASRRRITLNHNFRSRTAVLDAVNRVFSHVMRSQVTEIDYDQDARLHPGLPSTKDPAPRLHILSSKGIRAARQPLAEARLIAREIRQLVGQPLLDREGNPQGTLRYKDIAILLPTAKGVAPLVEKTLTQAGIPVYSEDGGAGMDSQEITQALCHLRLLNHLTDDLALLAALRGPVYQMEEVDLARIRLAKPEAKASFLEAMMALAGEEDTGEAQEKGPEATLQSGGDGSSGPAHPPPAAQGPSAILAQRCRHILQDLRHERFLLQSMPLDQYLWGFLSRSGMYSHYGAQPGGKLRQANLRMLCTRASDHVSTRGGDLQSFLETISAQSGVRDGRSPTVLSPWEDVVRLMTIHKSKGLEFPLVFVMGLGGALHRRSGSGPLALHPKLGVALRNVNEKARTKRATLLESAIALRSRAEEKAERARVLYVALTRARDQLVLVGSSASLTAEKATPQLGMAATPGAAYAVWEGKTLLDWLVQSLEKHDDITEREDIAFSTGDLWETSSETKLSIVPTCFPQKTGVWQVVFHSLPDKSTLSAPSPAETGENPENITLSSENRLSTLLQAARVETSPGSPSQEKAPEAEKGLEGPITPPFPHQGTPLKLGVTAFCRALEAPGNSAPGESMAGGAPAALSLLAPWAQPDAAPDGDPQPESPETKRLPLTSIRPRLLADLPTLPAYLGGEEKQTALLRGVATHKALSLLPLEGLQALAQPYNQAPEGAPIPGPSLTIQMEQALGLALTAMEADGRLTPQEARLVQIPSLARFFAAPLGLRALRAPTLHREWGFNLLLPALSDSILQGVIDLCFLEEGQWVLVDYKTDRVEKAADLWALYGAQIRIYRQALELGTGAPVRESVLFSLALGEGSPG